MQYKITIPEPCSQHWEEMIPNDHGRYCNACAKTVIDFTPMSDTQVKDFFLANNNFRVCGRFKKSQVHRIVIDLPENIYHLRMPIWMKFMIACLIIFGLSIFPFETTIAGKTAPGISFYQGEPLQVPQKKKKAKKHKKKKEIKYELTSDRIPIDKGMVLGGGWLSSGPALEIYKECVEVKEGNDSIISKESISGKEPEPIKDEPLPTPYTAAEFILPGFLVKKRKRNSAVD